MQMCPAACKAARSIWRLGRAGVENTELPDDVGPGCSPQLYGLGLAAVRVLNADLFPYQPMCDQDGRQGQRFRCGD